MDTAIEKMNTAALDLEKLPLSAKEKIILAIDSLLKGFNENANTSDYYFLITQTALSDAFPQEAKDIIRSKNNVKYEVMTRIFKQGQDEGTVKNFHVSEMATLFFSTMNGLALNKAIHRAEIRMPDKNIILGMFLKEL